MKACYLILLVFCAVFSSLNAEGRKKLRLNSEPDVVHFEDFAVEPLRLPVSVDAKIFADKKGKRRVGTLLKNQTVTIEAMTEKAYKVRGKGANGGIAGWVSPKAFELPSEDFVEHLQSVYQRQLEVQELIKENKIALGMSMDEVSKSIGEPTKSSSRFTAEGKESVWEFIVYDREKQYSLIRDPYSGQFYRRYSHTVKIEVGRKTIEFADGVVSAIEQAVTEKGGRTKIVVPPITFIW